MHSRDSVFYYEGYSFIVSKEVYRPAEDTWLLARNLVVRKGECVLDMGTGCGIMAVLTAKMAARAVAVDINPYAVVCARKNADLNGLRSKIDVLQGDLFGPLDSSGKFDLILFNPPYLPVNEDEGGGWIEKAWAGGETGRKVIDRFIEEVPGYTSQGGRILLVQSNLSNVETTLVSLDQLKLQAEVVDKEELDFEEIVLIEAKKQS